MTKGSIKPHIVVAANLYALRLRAGLTQEVLDGRAQMDLRSLQRIEAGAWNMAVDYLARLQKALGCRWRDLIAGLDTPPPAVVKKAKPGKVAGKEKGTHQSKAAKLMSKGGPRWTRSTKPAAKRGRA